MRTSLLAREWPPPLQCGGRSRATVVAQICSQWPCIEGWGIGGGFVAPCDDGCSHAGNPCKNCIPRDRRRPTGRASGCPSRFVTSVCKRTGFLPFVEGLLRVSVPGRQSVAGRRSSLMHSKGMTPIAANLCALVLKATAVRILKIPIPCGEARLDFRVHGPGRGRTGYRVRSRPPTRAGQKFLIAEFPAIGIASRTLHLRGWM